MREARSAGRLERAKPDAIRHALRNRRGGRTVGAEGLRGGPVRMSMKMSPDGMYYWDGQQWLSTLSLDGRFRWNGEAWVPTGQASAPTPQQQPASRQPTSWTRPLQRTVAAWYGLSGLYALSLPFWMSGRSEERRVGNECR